MRIVSGSSFRKPQNRSTCQFLFAGSRPLFSLFKIRDSKILGFLWFRDPKLEAHEGHVWIFAGVVFPLVSNASATTCSRLEARLQAVHDAAGCILLARKGCL